MNATLPTIRIRPKANLHGRAIFTTGIAISLMVLAILAITNLAHPALYVLLLSGLVTLFIGALKLWEPPFSLIISPQRLTYRHRYGQWHIDWDNMVRFDQATVSSGWSRQSLPYVGFRLNNPDQVLESVSLRLASRLLFEQRPLLYHALREQCPDGSCLNAEQLLEDDTYTSPSGTCYTGLLAMLGNRMARLHNLLGYDLFVPTNALDREPQAFIDLLRRCQTSRHHYLQKNQ